VTTPSTWSIVFGHQAPSLQPDELQDLATFFGPNPERFVAIYEKMRDQPGWWKPNFTAGYLGFVWFFYRKMYVAGALLTVLPIVLEFVMPIAGIALGSSIITGMCANRAYIAHALSRIKKARELDLEGEERAAYLRRAGGVSAPAAAGAAIFYAGMMALAAFQLM
jgi:hypothetical protein